MEKLTVKNLGPIKDFTMETNRLTVLIGPQASGKSLLAQMLYFFNEIGCMLAERYPFDSGDKYWVSQAINDMLSSLRGASIMKFLSNESVVSFESDNNVFEFSVEYGSIVSVLMSEYVEKLVGSWSMNRADISKYIESNNIFIPTERSMYSSLIETSPGVLFSDKMPYVLRRFAGNMEACSKELTQELENNPMFLVDGVASIAHTQEYAALGGATHCLNYGLAGRRWSFLSLEDATPELSVNELSSGQMESWPFFALGKVYGSTKKNLSFYFEEPETHLHPKAQVEVVKTIAYLISRGHRFVITTHSPFILYVINNLIQAHIAYDGNPPEGEFSINPDHVAAYCLGDNPRSIVDEETKLLNLDEIDDVLDSIGKQFYDLLNRDVKKNG